MKTLTDDRLTVTKVCRDCGRELPIDRFSPDIKNADGRATYCRCCYRHRYRRTHGISIARLTRFITDNELRQELDRRAREGDHVGE